MSDHWPLIRRLATEVMGWPVLTDFAAVGEAIIAKLGYVAEVPEAGFGGKIYDPYVSSGSRRDSAWNPFESIADAWLLVERFHEAGWSFELFVPEGEGAAATARIRRGDVIYAGFRDTVSEAICRVAQKTLPEAPHA